MEVNFDSFLESFGAPAPTTLSFPGARGSYVVRRVLSASSHTDSELARALCAQPRPPERKVVDWICDDYCVERELSDEEYEQAWVDYDAAMVEWVKKGRPREIIGRTVGRRRIEAEFELADGGIARATWTGKEWYVLEVSTCKGRIKHNPRVRELAHQIRDDALEEAAQVLERVAGQYADPERTQRCRHAAREVRALKSKP